MAFFFSLPAAFSPPAALGGARWSAAGPTMAASAAVPSQSATTPTAAVTTGDASYDAPRRGFSFSPESQISSPIATPENNQHTPEYNSYSAPQPSSQYNGYADPAAHRGGPYSQSPSPAQRVSAQQRGVPPTRGAYDANNFNGHSQQRASPGRTPGRRDHSYDPLPDLMYDGRNDPYGSSFNYGPDRW
ncbi:hypothetical protein EMIHUDRAFT_221516 [Emiliania huxleyi CCMP1516]|uniref:Uncharacterized protein n=2 Tax=Emiliania huxleyi TaxID=2903 RepID=A0A0D3HYK0_EMIH1|nr:hypothetical protein EMIHUDRAFT_221516 [Emiliania huxleyi CCMP1516]EOD04085.1 hypothetical protein EMIHUDRAFT_221516 [Emiliania huxleyi CCMP1516]|eukprot:XP_005756514.1 hypothetical protein EMIHUDRAFT_221516 [Emiliania huxleyi CCMP1516]